MDPTQTLEDLHDNRNFEHIIAGLTYATIMRNFENVGRRNELVDLRTIIKTGTLVSFVYFKQWMIPLGTQGCAPI